MKNRVRMIVVLVCVFVVLPVVGGLVYLSRTSAQDAARYYAEAIAQGRFEDAMAMETDKASGIVEPENVDLRRGQIAVPSSVTSVSLVGVRTGWKPGRQNRLEQSMDTSRPAQLPCVPMPLAVACWARGK